MFVPLLLFPGGLASGDQAIVVPGGAHNRGSWLRWDNLEGAPFWVDGPRPERSPFSGTTYHEIHPGHRVRLILPGSAMLRCSKMQGELRPEDISVWYSDGSGLQREARLVGSSQGESLFLYPLDAEPRLVEVWRRPEATGSVQLAFFISRMEFEDEVFRFHRLLSPQQGKAGIRRSGELLGEAYWSCPGGRPLALKTPGPARLMLVTRLCYDPEESRVSQSYRVRVGVDGDFREFRLETMTDVSARFTIDSLPRTLGLERRCHFEVPEGSHDLEIVCRPEVYWRLLQCDSGNMLLDDLESLKEPPVKDAAFRGFRLEPARDGAVAGDLDGLLRVLGKDAHIDDGLVAGMYFQGLSASPGTHPRDRAAAQSYQWRTTRYRNIFPVEKKDEAPQVVGHFIPRKLLDPGDPPEDLYIPRRQLTQALKGFVPGFFFRVPQSKESSQEYRIPGRFAPSLLRIAAAHGGEEIKELHLELEGGETVSLRVLPGPELPMGKYQASRAEAAFSIVRGRSEAAGGLAVEAALEGLGLSGEIVSAGTVEVPLPRTVETVRIWGKGDSLVAVQYLAESPLELTEMEARDAGWLDGSTESALLADYSRWMEAEGTRGGDAWNVSPGRSALFRLSSQAAGRFIASVAPPPERSFPRRSVSEQLLKQMQDAAAALEASGDLLPAFEKWSRLTLAPDPGMARLAKLKRLELLEAIGEQHLLEMQLRGICIHDPDARLRREAVDRLTSMYQAREETEALVGLFSAAGMAKGQGHLVPSLAVALAASGRHEMAQEVGLSLPRELQPLDLLLKCALKTRWMRTFESLFDRTESSEKRKYWRGLEALSDASPERALSMLRESGSLGEAWVSYLHRGLQIRQLLSCGDPARVSSAIFEWEAWEAAYPGDWLWVEDHESVVDHAGVSFCLSEGRNLLEPHYRSLPGRPLELRVAGPAMLRLEARPLHDPEPGTQIQGWVLVRGGAWLQVTPINNNLPSRELRLPGRDGKIPGTKVEIRVSLGPGVHDLEVLSEDVELLLRVLLRSPEFRTGILPRRTPRALAKAVGVTAEDAPPKAGDGHPSSVTCLDFDAAGRDMSFPIRFALPPDLLPSSLPETQDSVLPARLALRLGSRALLAEHSEGLREVASRTGLPVEERLLAMARLAELEGSTVDPALLSSSASPALQDMANLCAGNLASAIPADALGNEEELVRKLVMCLYVKEHAPALRKEAEVRGEAIFRARSSSPGLQSLFSRLVSDTDWEKITFVHESAGLREISPAPWMPESPELRIRHAMLSELEGQDRRIMGDARLRFLVGRRAPTTLRCDCTLEAVDFLPAAAVNLLFQLDDGPPGRRALLPEQPSVTLELAVPEGEHVLRFWQENPATNQGVRIHLSEPGKEQLELPFSGEGDDAVRQYHIATREKPLKFTVEGPAWIRMDELRGKETLVRYREIPKGWNDLVLEPEPWQEEALFRIFQRVPGTKATSRIVQPPVPAARVLEPTPFSLLERKLPSTILVDDVYSPGGQEDGTISLLANLQRRRAFDEDEELEFDQYLELRGTHRYLSRDDRSHYRTDLLTRIHEESGPTLGVSEDFHYRPRWLPCTLRLKAEGFLQWPEAPESGEVEWSAVGRASAIRRFSLGLKSYHQPSITAFGRLLSQDDADEHADAIVDQDVFTPYKRDHRAGLILSELLGYRPWLDTEIQGRASLTSNEDFHPGDPDHVSAGVVWKQFFRGLQVDLGYKATHFFQDSDRQGHPTRHTVSLDATYDLLLSPRDRLEVGLDFQHDFTADESMGFIFLCWHFSNGRHYRDFWPGDVDFRDLRDARIPASYNNSIREVHP